MSLDSECNHHDYERYLCRKIVFELDYNIFFSEPIVKYLDQCFPRKEYKLCPECALELEKLVDNFLESQE